MSFITPDLPYPYDALEPYIDARTMEIHHDKHHVGYTTKLNKALEGSGFEDRTIEELLMGLDSLPEDLKKAVGNNGGGHYNHGLFWKVMAPDAGGKPTGSLADNLERAFGGFNGFVSRFSEAAATRFGSGWAWLALDNKKDLVILSTANQDSPLSIGLIPILGLDVWEHAYYLKYQNRRPEYIENFFQVINWPRVSELYSQAL